LSVAADITDADVAHIVERATAFANGQSPDVSGSPIIGILFLTSSMRTRVGFTAASNRLGCSALPVTELRFDEKMSGAESLEDTLRVLTGMLDVLVMRSSNLLDPGLLQQSAACPVVNGGDAVEHPTQALIDIAAIEKFAGPVSEQRIAICGDARMRSVTSLLQFLRRMPPRSLVIASPQGREPIDADLTGLCEFVAPDDLGDFDVLLMPGLAPGTGQAFLDESARSPFIASARMLDGLSERGVVLSPMPVIDEIDDEVRSDPRLKMYEQSDLGVFVRMAVLEWVLLVNR
jgi:aspartate carbamoyltransferase catalytic subunit